mgnify:CR=1 FL=1
MTSPLLKPSTQFFIIMKSALPAAPLLLLINENNGAADKANEISIIVGVRGSLVIFCQPQTWIAKSHKKAAFT